MEIILVTGLDGSGKSTFIDRLEAGTIKNVFFLRIPVTDPEKFSQSEHLHNLCMCINTLNAKADKEQSASLKIIALFAAMLIFRELLASFEKNGARIVVCERHPLIDTAVYGRIYASKMDSELLLNTHKDFLDNNYEQELQLLLEMLPELAIRSKSHAYDFLSFIHDWFAVRQRFDLASLKMLFKVDLPNKIVYLKAHPDTLMERLSDRKMREVHETKVAFEHMIPIYDRIISDSGTTIEIVDANTFTELDRSFKRMQSYLSENE